MTRTAALTVIILLALLGCASPPPEVVPPGLDTYEGLAAALNVNRSDDATLVLVYDVRTPEEYATGHIPGAINVPVAEISRGVPRKLKHQPIVIYCQAGGRASAATNALIERGFTNVVNFRSVGYWKGELVTGTEPK